MYVLKGEHRVVQRSIMRAVIVCACILAGGAEALSQQYLIKFATYAPEGSTWMNIMRQFDQAVRSESGGRLGFKMYPGGVQGEDKDVMKRIRLGQLHSAGVTGVGIGDISTTLRILDAPFLFQSYEEVDHVHATFAQELEQEFRSNGFVLLGWAEVGFVYVFSKVPVRAVGDMKGVKMWVWESDPIAEAAFREIGVNPVPLSLVDVLTSLQTGLISGAYTSPLAALVLQWNTRVQYMLNLPLADAAGAVVISKKKFDELPPDLQEILLRNGRKYLAQVTASSRQDNAAATEKMKKNGLQVLEPSSPKAQQEYAAIGKRARQSLVGKLYDQAWLDRVEKAVSDFRAGKKTVK